MKRVYERLAQDIRESLMDIFPIWIRVHGKDFSICKVDILAMNGIEIRKRVSYDALRYEYNDLIRYLKIEIENDLTPQLERQLQNPELKFIYRYLFNPGIAKHRVMVPPDTARTVQINISNILYSTGRSDTWDSPAGETAYVDLYTIYSSYGIALMGAVPEHELLIKTEWDNTYIPFLGIADDVQEMIEREKENDNKVQPSRGAETDQYIPTPLQRACSQGRHEPGFHLITR